jgi:hypothetical protein
MRVQIKPDSGMGMYFVHVGGQQVGRCGKWYRAADGDRYVCTLAPHNDDVEHDGVRVSSG